MKYSSQLNTSAPSVSARRMRDIGMRITFYGYIQNHSDGRAMTALEITAIRATGRAKAGLGS